MPEPLLLPAFPRVTDYSGLWCVEETAAAAMIGRAKTTDWHAHLAANAEPKLRAAVQLLPAGQGRSVAVVRLDGTLMKASSSFGGTSTVQARRDIRAAAADPDVAAILLAIDSPGGTVSGTDDLAGEVRAANKQKPVWAFVSDLCASAAYWVASQCEAIYANSDTAWVGSIGTFLALYDLSKKAEKDGAEAVVFRTGPLKGAGAMDGDAITEEQRTHFQLLTEKSQETFDAAVKKGRDLTDNQLAAVRTGGVFTAADATARKLIDGVRSLDATVAALIKAANSRTRTGRAASANRGDAMPKTAATATDDADVIDLTPDFGDSRKAHAAEYRRIAGIQQVAAKHPAIVAEAIEQGWSVEKAELAAMKADLPKPPAATNPHAGGPVIVTTHGGPPDPLVIEAALCVTAGVKPEAVAATVPTGDRERVMNRALSANMRGYGLHALMDETIRQAGHHFHGGRKTDAFARAAVDASRELHHQRGQLRADGGFTTVSLPGILANVANKVMLASYNAQNVTWPEFAAVRSHSDFKVVTHYRLDSMGAFKKVGPDGELKHVGLAEASYTNQLGTYGAIIALTRQMMINDDLNAFAQVPTFLGRMSQVRVEEAVYVLLLANTGSFFAGGNSNLLTGGGSVLAIAGLTAAETAFSNQVDSNGKPIMTSPDRLLVPTTLTVTARNIYTEVNLAGETGVPSTTVPTANPHRGKYRPISSPYLNNTAIKDQDGAAISGQSSTAWYLFADPAVRAALAVAFLNGQRVPTIESSETEFQTLGMQWRGYHDFGVGFEDTTAALKNAGA